MLLKYVTTGLTASALLATVAFAQTPAATTDGSKMPAPAAAAVSDPTAMHGTWRSSKLVGLNVYNDSNEKLGDISDLLMDKAGNVKAVVIGVGGFLGMGERLVAVSFDQIKFVNEPVAYTGASATTNRPASTTTTGAASTNTAPAATATAAKPNPWYPDHAVFSISKEQLKAMPEFKYTI